MLAFSLTKYGTNNEIVKLARVLDPLHFVLGEQEERGVKT
jgi:hypothetical protein